MWNPERTLTWWSFISWLCYAQSCDWWMYNCFMWLQVFNVLCWKMFVDFVESHLTLSQLWAAIPVWVVPPGHIGWLSTWATWLLVKFWKSLGDRTDSCNLYCEGCKYFLSFCAVYVTANPYSVVLNFYNNYLSCCVGLISSMGLSKRKILKVESIKYGSPMKR